MNCKKIKFVKEFSIKHCNAIAFFFLCSVLAFSGIQIASGQSTEAKATLDSNVILIGQQVQFSIELKQDKKNQIKWPLFPDTIGKIEIISRGKIDTIATGDAGVLYRKQKLTITAFDSGYFVIPPISFNAVNGVDTTSYKTNPLLLTVMIMPVDTTKAIHDIKDLAEIPFNWRDYIWYFIFGIAGILLILVGVYVYMRYGKKVKPEIFVSKPKIPAHEVALTSLKLLDEEKHWQNGRYKYYHSSISEIVRTFIEQRWEIHAMEQITDEIVNHPKLLQLNPETRRQLIDLLMLSDLAKFAKLQPLANENEQSMRDAIKFVTECALKPEENKKEEVKA